jgi:hypothetical protein
MGLFSKTVKVPASKPSTTDQASANPAAPADFVDNPIQSAGIPTTDAWGMPGDLPLPIAESHGRFVQATRQPSQIGAYDPWTWAQIAAMVDDSKPEQDPYGGVSQGAGGGALNADWGGMPYPVRDYQDTVDAVLLVPRLIHNNQGPTGRFYGPQQTAWEASAQTPPTDYWSTIILQGGPAR